LSVCGRRRADARLRNCQLCGWANL
jgi:hypothetical protein